MAYQQQKRGSAIHHLTKGPKEEMTGTAHRAFLREKSRLLPEQDSDPGVPVADAAGVPRSHEACSPGWVPTKWSIQKVAKEVEMTISFSCI